MGAIELLSSAEREQVLYGWNKTGVPIPESTVVELFEQQVEKNPLGVAVVYEERSLAYAELNAGPIVWRIFCGSGE